ncbi:hypothetical protein AAMO2058_000684300 [Amorphochlora amoebiformis]
MSSNLRDLWKSVPPPGHRSRSLKAREEKKNEIRPSKGPANGRRNKPTDRHTGTEKSDEFDRDLLLAIKLSQQEAEAAKKAATEAKAKAKSQEDADFALALSLSECYQDMRDVPFSSKSNVTPIRTRSSSHRRPSSVDIDSGHVDEAFDDIDDLGPMLGRAERRHARQQRGNRPNRLATERSVRISRFDSRRSNVLSMQEGSESKFDIGDMGVGIENLRVDVDNMSYDQLLDIERKNGQVAHPGASRQEIERLPESQYTNTKRSSKISKEENKGKNSEKEECSICLSEYEQGEATRRLPCLHMFHKECVDLWLRDKAECPCCRTKI